MCAGHGCLVFVYTLFQVHKGFSECKAACPALPVLLHVCMQPSCSACMPRTAQRLHAPHHPAPAWQQLPGHWKGPLPPARPAPSSACMALGSCMRAPKCPLLILHAPTRTLSLRLLRALQSLCNSCPSTVPSSLTRSSHSCTHVHTQAGT